MMYRVSKVLFVVCLLVVGCEDEDCVKVSTVTPVFLAAMDHPESFDTYVADNQNAFDANFYKCLDQKLVEVQEAIDSETDECNESFGGTGQWVECYNDNVLGPENLLSILYGIKIVTSGAKRWDETNVGVSLMITKYSDPEAWDELMATFYEQELDVDCVVCESRRCFLGICR